jgi:hypothetical protein
MGLQPTTGLARVAGATNSGVALPEGAEWAERVARVVGVVK